MKYIHLLNNHVDVSAALGIQSYKLKDTISEALSSVGIDYPNFDDWFGKVFVETAF